MGCSCLLFVFYEVCNEADDYGYDDDGYEVYCGLGEGDVPLWGRIWLNGYDFVEGCAPDICCFDVE